MLNPEIARLQAVHSGHTTAMEFILQAQKVIDAAEVCNHILLRNNARTS